MITESTYTKSLCMKRLTLKKYICDAEVCYEPSFFSNAALGFSVSGIGELRSFGTRLTILPGTLFYIPESARCTAVWHSDKAAASQKPIEFFIIHIINNYPETPHPYAMQIIDELSTPDTHSTLEKMTALLSSEKHSDKVRAIGLYYSLFADILPYLETSTARKPNQVITAAIDYIEKHFSEDFGIDELASHCNISASRLSHIFDEELGTSPVKLRTTIRLENAAELLRTTDDSIAKISQDCGWSSPIYFSKVFRNNIGATPSEYRAAIHKA